MTKTYMVKKVLLSISCLIFALPSTLDGRQRDNIASSDLTESAKREAIIAKARQYAQHKWTASSNNVLHGLDANGNRVDTPDQFYRKGGFVVGEENVGIPYKWGGFSTIEDFEQGIGDGMIAGHLPKRGSSRASAQAVGVDCSGLVSRCWDLPRKHSTRSLGNLCYELASYDSLLPGDIINSFDGHVVIFDSFLDSDRSKVAVYEAGGTRVEKSVYTISKLRRKGFKPLRYKPLDEQWAKVELAPASILRENTSAGKFEALENSQSKFADLGGLIQSAKAGDWARYSMGNNEEMTLSVTEIKANGVLIRNRLAKAEKNQLTERAIALDGSVEQTLIDLAGFDQDFGDLTLTKSRVQAGTYQFAERNFDALQIELELKTSLLIRGTDYPTAIKINCVVSDEVPLAGLLKSRYFVEIKDGDKIFGRSIKYFELLGFFKG